LWNNFAVALGIAAASRIVANPKTKKKKNGNGSSDGLMRCNTSPCTPRAPSDISVSISNNKGKNLVCKQFIAKMTTFVGMNRSQQIIRTSVVGIVTNVLLAAFKAAVGVISHSIAIVMDAVNNLSDVLSSVITIVGTKLSQRPADRKHPFGHGRVEYFSAIIIAVIVLSAGVTSLIESAKKLIHPTEPSYTTVTLIIIVTAIVVKLVLGRYVKKQGEKLQSDALIASGSDALFDAIITLATLISAGVMLIWGFSLDGILGVLISLFIIKAGVEMIASPVNELLGARVSPELIAQIKKEIMEFDEVHGIYDIILHNYGHDLMIGSLHVSVDDTLTAQDIHGLTREISLMMFREHHIIMTVGIYSVATGDNKRRELQTLVTRTLAAHPEIVQVHGFYCSEKHNYVTVDVVPDYSVKDEKALCESLTLELSALIPDRTVSVTVDHNFSE